MSYKHQTIPIASDTGHNFRLWIGMLLPPVIWAIQFEAVYISSEWACYSIDYKWIHLASIVALVISLVATWIAFSEFRSSGGLSIEGTE